MPPFGYKKDGERKDRHLVVVESEAAIVKYIFNAYLKDIPLYVIKKNAIEMGLNRKGNSLIEKILKMPEYAGMQYVEAFKDYPGGLFPAIHQPIVEMSVWEQVQRKMKRPEKKKIVVAEELPLRGVLKCHCGKNLTGAPSKGRWGGYYYYYKCVHSKHNSISAKTAHKQMSEIQELMSIPDKIVKAVKSNIDQTFENKLKDDKALLAEKKRALEAEEAKLLSIEEKWITNTISQETYERWHSLIVKNRIELKAFIDRVSGDQVEMYNLVMDNIDYLTDMKFIYEKSTVLEKQDLLNIEFDNNLYYEQGMYRTPIMLDALSSNYMIMREKKLLEYKKRGDDLTIIPLSGEGGCRIFPYILLIINALF